MVSKSPPVGVGGIPVRVGWQRPTSPFSLWETLDSLEKHYVRNIIFSGVGVGGSYSIQWRPPSPFSLWEGRGPLRHRKGRTLAGRSLPGARPACSRQAAALLPSFFVRASAGMTVYLHAPGLTTYQAPKGDSQVSQRQARSGQ